MLTSINNYAFLNILKKRKWEIIDVRKAVNDYPSWGNPV